jgi:hypothetical protein
LRPATFDVAADARVVRIGRNTSFGRVLLVGAADKRPVGMVASAYLEAVRKSSPIGENAQRRARLAFHPPCKLLSLSSVGVDAEKKMRRNLAVVIALALSLPCVGESALAGAVFVGPPPGLTGNDTGGIITYSPGVRLADYHEIAANWCARWGRLSHLTSVHRRYGDYVAFICMDHPGIVH